MAESDRALLVPSKNQLTAPVAGEQVSRNHFRIRRWLASRWAFSCGILSDLFEASKYLLHDAMSRVNLDFTQHVCYQPLAHLLDAIRQGSPAGLQEFGPWQTLYPHLSELPRPALTAREVEVLRTWLLLDSKPAVAGSLGISLGTVNTHLTRIRAKYADLGRPAPTKAGLVARAVQDELISLDEL